MGRHTGSNRNFWDTLRENNVSYNLYLQRFTELAISMFEWKNLPDSVDERFMELTLFGEGKAIFFKDDVLGFLCLKCAAGGKLDVYQVPTMRRAIASSGYNKELDETNSVIIYNNLLRTPSWLTCYNAANRIWELDRAIDVNAKAQKTPILITCDQNQRLTLKQVYMKYSGDEPVIFGDKKLNPEDIKVLQTGAPYVADKLTTLKKDIWNETLTYLGISNLNVQKKERLISDEVLRNQGGTIASRYSRLNARRQACEQINKMFDLDIWCDYREDYREADDEVMIANDTEPDGRALLAVDVRTRTGREGVANE